MNKTRLEAFSDGVFAIVITLLILNVKLPETDYAHLANALKDTLPSVGIYVLSFLLVGMYWVFHHYSFTLIDKVDGIFLWLNILFLLFISFLPFPTMLMGKYPFHSLPIIIYCCNLLAANATGFILVIYLNRNKNLASQNFTPAVYKMQLKLYLGVNLMYIITILLGFFIPTVSFIILIIMTLGLIFRSVRLSGIGQC